MKLDQSLILAQTSDAFSATIFPELEHRLASAEDVVALIPVAKVKQYRSLVDLFIVEANPMLETACIRFYHSGGRPLTDFSGWGGDLRIALLERALALLESARTRMASRGGCRWRDILKRFDLIVYRA